MTSRARPWKHHCERGVRGFSAKGYALSTLKDLDGGCERRRVADRQIESLATSSIGSVTVGYKKSSLRLQATQRRDYIL